MPGWRQVGRGAVLFAVGLRDRRTAAEAKTSALGIADRPTAAPWTERENLRSGSGQGGRFRRRLRL